MKNLNLWGIALALIGALALLVGCGGGGGTDPGGNGGGSGGSTLEPRWLTVEVVPVADDVDVSDMTVTIRWNKDADDTAPVRFADYVNDPFVLDMNAVSPYNGSANYFAGISVKLEGAGLYSQETAFVSADGIKASDLDTYIVHPVVARDLNGAGWTCTKVDYMNGNTKPPETKTAEVSVGLNTDDPYADYYSGGIHAFNDTWFWIVGDKIFGSELDNGYDVETTGSVAASSSFDYKKEWVDQDFWTSYHCER